ncbi:dynein heavy chain 14 [Huso huso]|uniref:Dynein heavy chain 14 n=1 Tax=Huso huso TaxID=61971 RepID=A0ABR0ZVP0_HUSHU
MVQEWLGFWNAKSIPISSEYTLITTMTEKTQWQNEGLPPDQNSTENVILVKNGGHWPLFIDPQGQTYKWICQMEGDKLNKVFASDPNYMKTVETAIQ